MKARGAIVAALACAATAVSACSASDVASGGELTADSTCEEYMQREAAERRDAAIRISTQVDGVSNPGNPMWGLSADAACGSNPSMTLGDYFDTSN